MTDKNLTEIVAILDRSGSMRSLCDETIGGFNGFLEEQKKTEGQAKLTLIQFDHEYQIDYAGVDIKEVQPLTKETYSPRGWTALMDAVGRAVVTTGDRLAKLEEDKRPGQVIFLIITDGEENSSKEFAADKVREMVKHQTDVYNWTFVFMGGGDINSQKAQAISMGIPQTNSYQYSADVVGTSALYRTISKGVSRRRLDLQTGDAPVAAAAILTDDEKDSLINK